MAQATAFAKRFPTALYRPDCGWEIVSNLEPSRILDGVGQFFERAAWFYEATGMSEGMAHPVVGADQAYLGAYRDVDGHWLDGSRTYRLRIPAGAPAQRSGRSASTTPSPGHSSTTPPRCASSRPGTTS